LELERSRNEYADVEIVNNGELTTKFFSTFGDQILRLTPRFSWSGCHKTYPNNVAMYVCKGGRSFTVDHHRQYGGGGQRQQQQGWRQHRRGGDGVSHGYGSWGAGHDGRPGHGHNRPTTWYIALSNCGSLFGLELRYRMEVRPTDGH